MQSVEMLKRRVLRQQKEIDALTRAQSFLFGFLAGLADIDLTMAARALNEMMQEPDIKEDTYFYARLERFKEISERALGAPEEDTRPVPSWFRGIIKGGLSENDEER